MGIINFRRLGVNQAEIENMIQRYVAAEIAVLEGNPSLLTVSQCRWKI